jgi:hypothetical protein
MCTDITLETVALDTRNNVAVFTQLLQLNEQQPPVLIQNRTSLPFSDTFTLTATQHITIAMTRALQIVNNRMKNIHCDLLQFFRYSQQKQILFLNFLVFPLFCPPLYIKINSVSAITSQIKSTCVVDLEVSFNHQTMMMQWRDRPGPVQT